MDREKYIEHCQISEMECFAKIVESFYLLTILTKQSISDVWQSSGYASWALKVEKKLLKQFQNYSP